MAIHGANFNIGEPWVWGPLHSFSIKELQTEFRCGRPKSVSPLACFCYLLSSLMWGSGPLTPRGVFMRGRRQQDLANSFEVVCSAKECRDFPRSYRDPPTRTYPSGTDTPEPLRDLDPIWTRFGPEITLFRSESGRNRVEIRSESGPGGGVRVGRCRRGRSGCEGPCSSSGKPLKEWDKTSTS